MNTDTGRMMFSLLTLECKQIDAVWKNHKIGFRGKKKKTYKKVLSAPYN